MKWFDKWFAKKCKQAWESVQNESYQKEEAQVSLNLVNKSSRAIKVRESDSIASEPIQFKMFKANGGWAIEFRQYDRRNDSVDTNLYVVNDEVELGKSISQIITMEALKR